MEGHGYSQTISDPYLEQLPKHLRGHFIQEFFGFIKSEYSPALHSIGQDNMPFNFKQPEVQTFGQSSLQVTSPEVLSFEHPPIQCDGHFEQVFLGNSWLE